jgi:hypothetical protein
MKPTRRNRKTKKNLNRKTKKNLNRKRKMKGGEHNEECAICLEDLNNSEVIQLSKKFSEKQKKEVCGHKFHLECMSEVCEKSPNTETCTCPLCRTPLSPEEMTKLIFEPKKISTDSIDGFKEYINNKLRAPTAHPLDKLKKELEKFISTDLPLYMYDDKIMEFSLENRRGSRLHKYQFKGIVERVPGIFSRGSNKYFKFLPFSEDEWEAYDIGDIDDYYYIVGSVEEL